MKRILVVEDDEINMEIMLDMLDALGFEAEGASDGQEAIQILLEPGRADYHVILMDIHMPIMDGYETTKQIRALDTKARDIPILAMTGDCFAEDKRMAKVAGMNGFITKPVNIGDILQAIEEVL